MLMDFMYISSCKGHEKAHVVIIIKFSHVCTWDQIMSCMYPIMGDSCKHSVIESLEIGEVIFFHEYTCI